METIVTNESFSEANLLSLIMEGNVEGLKSFISEIGRAITANWEIAEKNHRIMAALKAAGFTETDQFKRLKAINNDIMGTNSGYNSLRNRAESALDELA